jgi:hypothetical protein
MGGSSRGALSEALEMIGGRVHQGIASSAGVKKVSGILRNSERGPRTVYA